MVRIEITKVILSRGDHWALVEYRTAQGRSTFGGNFGCLADTLVPGQIFKGDITVKRDRTGRKKVSFKGVPVARRDHALKHALKTAGINWTDRAALFAQYNPVSGLFAALKDQKSAELMSIQKIGRKKLQRMYSAYAAIAQELSMSLELSKALPALHRYLNENQTAAILKWHKDMAAFVKFVVHDPWRIMYDKEYDSFTYECQKRADFLSATTPKSCRTMVEKAILDLKLTSNDPRARRVAAIHKLREYMKASGSYWMRLGHFLGDSGQIDPNWPCVMHDNHVALVKYADIEAFIGKTFAAICTKKQSDWIPPPSDALLDQTQRTVVVAACEEPIFIVNGGAGTGKTTVSAAIVKSLKGDVLCAAPTGKAAQRLAQVTGIEAYTVHRLAYMSEDTPLSSNLLLDEQSMQEPEILALLLKKRSFNKIIFVGDTAQLTSVGPGQFFRDLCDSSLPRIELTKIYRSSETSYISSNGQKIRNGDSRLDYSDDSFMVHRYTTDEDIIEMARTVFAETNKMPMVLCNTNSEVSKLNGPLRQICNPLGASPCSHPVNMDYSNKTWRYTDWRFGLGDSVINTVNQYDEDTKELMVANGEIGTVTKVSGANVTVRFDRLVHFNLKEDPTIRPAYALTVNKSQGSEYPVVIVKSTSSWGDKRERFYTAVTRAKDKCIIYEVHHANSDCIRAEPSCRKTYLLKR
jgi:hypothetical protein